MECLICFEPTTVPYEIKCGSKVAHEICHSCETTLRLQTKPTRNGRTIKCPVCRRDEQSNGNRTRASYEAELRVLYRELYPRILPFERPVVQFPQYVPRLATTGRAPRVTFHAPSAPEPIVAPLPEPPAPESRNWCKNRPICPTKNKTTRKCSYPMGCVNKVCRNCKMCVSHFEF